MKRPLTTKEKKHFYGPLLSKKDDTALASFISKNQLSIAKADGPIKTFEDKFSHYMGGGSSLLTQSGTAAILTALISLGLKKGDEIIFPVFGFHACVMPARLLGLNVIFAPVNDEDLLLDVSQLEKYLNGKTKAVFLIHLFGQPVDLDPLFKLKKHFSFKIIADCSHAFMAEYNNQPVGTFSDIAIFSLQQNKFLAAGEGGVIWSLHDELIDRIKLLAHPGRQLSKEFSDFQGISFGLKFRPHPIVAWLANSQLTKRKKILKSHKKALCELKAFFIKKEINVSFLPVEKEKTKAAGFCYLKFRLPDTFSETQIGFFKKEIKSKGILVKPEHFVLMSDLPNVPPFEFMDFKLESQKKKSWSVAKNEDKLRSIINRQFAIRIPTTWEDGDLKRFYSKDLKLIQTSYKEAFRV